MKKKLVILAIICLNLFVFRDFIIRQYFISKIEYVDYDEYILLDYLNSKKNKETYVGADFMVVLEYDLDGETVEGITAYDYDKRIMYQYNLLIENLDKNANNEDRPMNLNNDRLLELLKSKNKFNFKGISEIKNRECYVLEFKLNKEHIITIYLDEKLLYVVKYMEQFLSKDKQIDNDYELDLELKNKDLFEDYIN